MEQEKQRHQKLVKYNEKLKERLSKWEQEKAEKAKQEQENKEHREKRARVSRFATICVDEDCAC